MGALNLTEMEKGEEGKLEEEEEEERNEDECEDGERGLNE